MLVETKNRTLEETAALFDGGDLAQRVEPVADEVSQDDQGSDQKVVEKVAV